MHALSLSVYFWSLDQWCGPLWALRVSFSYISFFSFFFFVDSSGHGKKPLISYQIIKKTKDDFPNLSFCVLCCAILRAVPTLLMSEGLPDVVLDDLVSCKFHVKKRPEGFISNYCLQLLSSSIFFWYVSLWATHTDEVRNIFVRHLSVYHAIDWIEKATSNLSAICLSHNTALYI